MSTLISIKEVSKVLGISQNTVRNRISKGKLPAPDKRDNGALFWEPAKINPYLEGAQ